jgi:cell division septum initiation protein DivIVA
MRARRLHPGVAAKEATKSAALAEGADAKAANAMGDKAYRGAMRAMQDGFWRSVGIPCALARIGPARRRLTRAEWHAEKAGVAAAAEALQVADVARAEADTARHAAAMVTDAAEAQRVAAESLEARAEIAAARARAAIAAAREQATEAKAAADTAQAARVEAEQQARMLAARGRRLVEQAHGEARRILGSARAEAERMRRGARGLGAWFGALVHGLRGVAPAVVARDAAAVARAEEQAIAAGRAALSRIESERVRKELRQAETRLAAVSDAAASLGAQRDRLARELDRLRPGAPTGTAPTPRRR